MSIVSVIVPVYNAEKYLRECLDSLQGQTLKDIEIICVDDGSKDNSSAILQEYASKDKRFHIITQENSGAGTARNRGITHASGKYLSILDADDFFEKNMLEKCVNKAEEEKSEIVVFESWNYNNETQEIGEEFGITYKGKLPGNGAFSWRDIPEYIFNFSSGCAWNKLFLRKFVQDNDLRFKEIRIADDIFFVMMALIKAEKISILEERLMYYRINNGESQIAHIDTNPEICIEAYAQFWEAAKRLPEYEAVERSLMNRLLKICMVSLSMLKDFASYQMLFSKLKEKYFDTFGFLRYEANYFYEMKAYAACKAIYANDLPKYLYLENKKMESRIRKNILNRSCIFPFDSIKKGVEVILYGAGRTGITYYEQLISTRHCRVKLWVDQKYREMGEPVQSPEKILNTEYEYIIICVESGKLAGEIKKYLLAMGVCGEKIFWKEPEYA